MAPSAKEREAHSAAPAPGTAIVGAGLEDWQVPPVEDELPPPAYGSIYGTIENEQDGLGTRATIAGWFRTVLTDCFEAD